MGTFVVESVDRKEDLYSRPCNILSQNRACTQERIRLLGINHQSDDVRVVYCQLESTVFRAEQQQQPIQQQLLSHHCRRIGQIRI